MVVCFLYWRSDAYVAETTAVGIRPPTLMSTTVRPKKHDKSFLARWAPVAQAPSLSRYKPLSLSLSFFLSLFCPARVHVHCALFFPLRLSTGHTIRLLSRYRPIVRRVNGGMRDNCATLQNAFGAISIYSSIENIYTSNSFSRREVLDLCEYLFRIKFNECF